MHGVAKAFKPLLFTCSLHSSPDCAESGISFIMLSPSTLCPLGTSSRLPSLSRPTLFLFPLLVNNRIILQTFLLSPTVAERPFLSDLFTVGFLQLSTFLTVEAIHRAFQRPLRIRSGHTSFWSLFIQCYV